VQILFLLKYPELQEDWQEDPYNTGAVTEQQKAEDIKL
jgi:hypothetical protein